MAKEKETTEPGAQLFQLLEEKGRDNWSGVLNWPKWYLEQTKGAPPHLTPIEPSQITGNTFQAALHFGLLIMHGGGHPLFNKLTNEEKEAMQLFHVACNRIFAKQEDKGIYGTFHARLNATR